MSSITPDKAYFHPLGESRYEATEATGGAWNPHQQHIAPTLGLLVHALEQRPEAGNLQLARLSFDIYGTVPIGEVEISTSVLRPGRTIELSEATLSHDHRSVAVLRAWSLAAFDTADLEVSPLPELPARNDMDPWSPGETWPGGFIRSFESYRRVIGQGRAQAWLRPETELVSGQEVSPLARYIGVVDVANGLSLAVDPRTAAFPNVDSTVSLFRQPRGEWVGLDTTQSAGPGGVGLTQTVLHDDHGPVGTLTQTLTIRRAAGSA